MKDSVRETARALFGVLAAIPGILALLVVAVWWLTFREPDGNQFIDEIEDDDGPDDRP